MGIFYKRYTKEEFIEKAKEVHGDRYDYSLVEYFGNKIKVKIICSAHGEFFQKPNHHLSSKCGCGKCGKEQMAEKAKNGTELFIKQAKEIHGDKYDYSLVDYKSGDKNVKIICSKHGVFEQLPEVHILGRASCTKCSYEERGENLKVKQDDFIKRAKEKHGDKYDYSLSVYSGMKNKFSYTCPKHGVISQTASAHVLLGSGCRRCRESKGEKEVAYFLKNNKIEYVPQKKFDNCRNILPLPFDFYIPSLNICIEFDGGQHFKPVRRFGGVERFKKIQINDSIKNDFCQKERIKLIRIIEIKNIQIQLHFLTLKKA